MEQRPNYRLPVEIDVWLYNDNDLHAKARIINISKDGMFIKTNVMLLALGSELKVAFEIRENDELQNCVTEELERATVSVTVIHRCLDGIGVKIEEAVKPDEYSVVSLLAHITTKSYLAYKNRLVA